jgi:hypothetical protein
LAISELVLLHIILLMYKLLFFIFFVFSMLQSSKTQTLLKAKIICQAENLEAISVFNSTTNAFAKPSSLGFFEIVAKPNDVLFFSGIQIQETKIILQEADFSKKIIFVRLNAKVTILEEVKVQNTNQTNAVSLGIVSKDIKNFTPAERRLYEAGDFNPIQLLGLLGGSLPLNPILNAINGRTKQLKKQLVVERKEMLISKLNILYKEEYFTKTLKIPSEYVLGFKYFAVENNDLANAIKIKNIEKTTLILVELSEKFIQNNFIEKE